ncbi:MAG: KUP/HAK/KT family potassium transporter [Alphaproteobacteria bacterium]
MPPGYSLTMRHDRQNLIPLIATLGVVYGDIGTSPLYAIRECFSSNIGLNEANVLGVLSLIFWALMLVVTLKYVLLILRAHNNGEGGILALMALISNRRLKFISSHTLIAMGLLGSALFFGDTIITPAISVLSALEGITLSIPKFNHYIVPASIFIIILLFLFQSKGTDKVGALFGPIMLIWFLTIGGLGLWQILGMPSILKAISPWYGIQLAMAYPKEILPLLGFVVLCITGAEALYADMGHFGARAIRISWLSLVGPCLILNYFGQGVAILQHPEAVANPFYFLVPEPFLLYMVALATVASIIASQSVISGLFSLVGQAIQLDYLPRLKIIHTSSHAYGRIYIPAINWLLCICVVTIILVFKNSDKLADAYGFSVSGVMVMTSLLAMVAMLRIFRWKVITVLLSFGLLFLLDLAFLSANSLKLQNGGWMPMTIAILVWSLMHLWHRQNKRLNDKIRKLSLTFSQFFQKFSPNQISRIPGTAVFLSKDFDHIPLSLIKYLEHSNCLGEQVVILTILSHTTPRIPKNERIFIQHFSNGFVQVIAHHGFMQSPRISTILKDAQGKGLLVDIHNISFFLLAVIPVLGSRLRGLRGLGARIFRVLLRNTTRTANFFEIPHQKVMELGVQFKISDY